MSGQARAAGAMVGTGCGVGGLWRGLLQLLLQVAGAAVAIGQLHQQPQHTGQQYGQPPVVAPGVGF